MITYNINLYESPCHVTGCYIVEMCLDGISNVCNMENIFTTIGDVCK